MESLQDQMLSSIHQAELNLIKALMPECAAAQPGVTWLTLSFRGGHKPTLSVERELTEAELVEIKEWYTSEGLDKLPTSAPRFRYRGEFDYKLVRKEINH